MAKEPKQHHTYVRIVEASLKLFNESGERNISTNHIAQYLDISPGNLYYHFANKDEIIVQLFKRYSRDLLGYLSQTPLPRTVEDAVGYMQGVYDVMWQYRFLFSDVNTLLLRSTELLGEHNEFTRERIAPLLIRLLEQMQDLGMVKIDAIGMRDLSVNMWLITKYWLDFDRSVEGDDSSGEYGAAAKQRGVRRTLSLLRPYLQGSHLARFDELMAQGG